MSIHDTAASLLVGMMLFASHGAEAAEFPIPPMDCGLGFDALVEQAANIAGASVAQEQGWTVVMVDDPIVVYSATPEDHYAYPTITRRDVFEEDGAWYVTRSACGYGDEAAFERLKAEFDDLDEQMKADLRRSAGGQ